MLTPSPLSLHMTRLNHSDLLALGFMTFALFLGAGNIIFPPLAGLQAGEHLLPAAAGFLITAVGLPLLTVVALARVGGGLPALTAPLGRRAGTALAVAVYLVIGPLFATPRAAVASFEIGISPFSGMGALALTAYTSVFFLLVWAMVLFPGRLIDIVGKLITPVLIVALVLLGVAGLWHPAGPIAPPQGDYVAQPLLKGFLEGYLTMDALGAMVFGIVIASAVRDRGVQERRLVTRYSVIAVLIAATALAGVYLSLFYLGAGSNVLARGVSNGGELLTRYVQHTFGTPGQLLLAVVIVLACLTTAVGLMTACGEFFSELFGLSYRLVASGFVLLSTVISNVGLTQLIQFSIPVLVGLYPLAIVLVGLSLADGLWRVPERVFRPVMAVTFVCGAADGLYAAGLLQSAPLAQVPMGWALPVLVTLVIAAGADRLRAIPAAHR